MIRQRLELLPAGGLVSIWATVDVDATWTIETRFSGIAADVTRTTSGFWFIHLLHPRDTWFLMHGPLARVELRQVKTWRETLEGSTGEDGAVEGSRAAESVARPRVFSVAHPPRNPDDDRTMVRGWTFVGQLLACAMVLCTTGEPAAGAETAPSTNIRAAAASGQDVENLVKDGPEFEVDLGSPDVATCFVYPEERRDDVACAGVDVEAVKARMGKLERSKILAVAILHEGKFDTLLMVLNTKVEMAQTSSDAVERTANEILTGMGKSTLGAVDKLAQPARLLQVGPLQVLHLRVKMSPVVGSPELVVVSDSYFVLTAGGTRMAQFITLSQYLPAMEPVMERLVHGVRGTPTQRRPSSRAESLGYELGYATGRFVLPVFVIAVLVVGGLIATRRKKRQKSQPGYLPPS